MPTTHTPGPWQANASLTRWHVTTVTKPRTYNICSMNSERIEQEANARLIAAAPALYAALKVLLVNRDVGEYESQKQGLPRMIEALDQAHAALAAADGREQP